MKVMIYSVEKQAFWLASCLGYTNATHDRGVWDIAETPATLDAIVSDISHLNLELLPEDAQIGILI